MHKTASFRTVLRNRSSGAGFSLWGFGLARTTKSHRLKPATQDLAMHPAKFVI